MRDWTIRRSGEEHREEWVCDIEYRKKERKRIKQYTKNEKTKTRKRKQQNETGGSLDTNGEEPCFTSPSFLLLNCFVV